MCTCLVLRRARIVRQITFIPALINVRSVHFKKMIKPFLEKNKILILSYSTRGPLSYPVGKMLPDAHSNTARDTYQKTFYLNLKMKILPASFCDFKSFFVRLSAAGDSLVAADSFKCVHPTFVA